MRNAAGNNLGDDDFLLQDLHGVIGAAGLFLNQNDFPKRSLSQQLQIVKVIHCLDKQRENDDKQLLWVREARLGQCSHLSFVVADGRVHLLLVDVLDLGDGAAQDALLLLFGQRVGHHLDGLGPLIPATEHTSQ